MKKDINGSKEASDCIQFEFQGSGHTVHLLSSRSSTNIVMKVDDVTHRSHVVLAKGVEQENWLDDAQLIEFAKRAIDPDFGVLNAEDIDKLRQECEDFKDRQKPEA